VRRVIIKPSELPGLGDTNISWGNKANREPDWKEDLLSSAYLLFIRSFNQKALLSKQLKCLAYQKRLKFWEGSFRWAKISGIVYCFETSWSFHSLRKDFLRLRTWKVLELLTKNSSFINKNFFPRNNLNFLKGGKNNLMVRLFAQKSRSFKLFKESNRLNIDISNWESGI